MDGGGIKTCVTVLCLMVLLNGLTVYEIVALENTTICHEGHFVEGVSAFCYLFSAIIIFFRSHYRRGLERRLTWIFATTCLLFFVRELDVEDFNVPSLLIFLGADVGRDVLFSSLYLVSLMTLILAPKERAELCVGPFCRSPVVWVVMLACVTLLVARFFESLHWNEVEEILEMNGSLLILLAAILHERFPLGGSLERD